mmetsp:Transcript_2425/g.4091  ORF Transcript_2425/g.4091 Transcript_2425/m.4091 type:complete len:1254 (+) Transcript_2425:103-3864(+)|eukprot:CAMPEP_0119299300 /NCGR_PEP_ID=MMETSP1333-20130426/1387_1 /TAXON_ID=418940 /ORGANISM="Scyphosphaera apsteinii, Strain RCC1455" /LENGTH=1253 /DNA_ID=CAMNT_0007300679 /DNA_START=103 /DNA_END=3864 /DNA_ORIENTATION=-
MLAGVDSYESATRAANPLNRHEIRGTQLLNDNPLSSSDAKVAGPLEQHAVAHSVAADLTDATRIATMTLQGFVDACNVASNLKPSSALELGLSKKHELIDEAGMLTQILSGLVCGFILFIFSCLFSSMLFDQDAALAAWSPLGPNVNTVAIFIGTLFYSRLSGCKAVIPGPDINPVVFFAQAMSLISLQLCPGVHTEDKTDDHMCDGTSLMPTVLASLFLGSILTGIAFLLVGKFRLTNILGYVPATLVCGFLSCIGFKVLKAAIEVASPVPKPLKLHSLQMYLDWETSGKHIVASLPVGVPLYLFKRYHIGKPTQIFPFFILVPLTVFYSVLLAQGITVDEARDAGWFHPKAPRNHFWLQWFKLYGKVDEIEWWTLPKCVPTFMVMLIMVSLDNMLQLVSSESGLKVDFDYNQELKTAGIASIVCALFVGMPVYGQTKFNVLNYNITHTTNSSIATLVCGAFCGCLFFVEFPVSNYLPRFLLGGLLLFSALGFLVENLYAAKRQFTRKELGCVWATFILHIIAGEIAPQFGLLVALLIGLLLAALSFAVHFARRMHHNELDLGTIPGEEHCSTAIRSASQEMKLGVLAIWYHIIQARGYIFFGSAARLYQLLKNHIKTMSRRPRPQRTKIIIWDMTEVFGIDATAGMVFVKVKRLAQRHGIQLVWAGLKHKVRKGLSRTCPLSGDTFFDSLDAASKWVEDFVLHYAHQLAHRWLIDSTASHIYNKAILKDALTAATSFSPVKFGSGLAARTLLAYASKVVMAKDEQVLTAGQPDDGLYLLYRGKVHVYEGNEVAATIFPGAFFNEHSLTAPPGAAALQSARAADDCVMLRLSKEQRDEMYWRDPHVNCELTLAVFTQVEMRTRRVRHFASSWQLSAAEAAISNAAAATVARQNSLRMSKALLFKERSLVREATFKALLQAAFSKDPVEAPQVRSCRPVASSTVKADAIIPYNPLQNGSSNDTVHPVREVFLDREFLEGRGDYRVALPGPMKRYYARIFSLIDRHSQGVLKVEEIHLLMASLGHQTSIDQVKRILCELGVGNGTYISEDSFLEFMRRTLLIDLSSRKVDQLDALFDEVAGWRHPSTLHDMAAASNATSANSYNASARGGRKQRASKKQVSCMLQQLRLQFDESTFSELFDEVDCDGMGSISRDELLALVAMIKRALYEVLQLSACFERIAAASTKISSGDTSAEAKALKTRQGDATVCAADLVAALGVNMVVAEEMIFIADLSGTQAVDFTEFKHIVVNWSSC